MAFYHRRRILTLLPGLVAVPPLLDACATLSDGRPAFDQKPGDYHGYPVYSLRVDGCTALVVVPKAPLPRRQWVWRTLFWNSFQDTDIAFLEAGFYVAYIGVGNTFGCPDAMLHFDAFYSEMTTRYGLNARPVLEGLSRGGLYAYRWAYRNADKVGAIYGDAPVCDMKSWPGGKFSGHGSPQDWAEAIRVYHFSTEAEMMAFNGNPIDILAPLAAARVPVIHVCGDADTTVPMSENTEIVRQRYMALGGPMAVIVKDGCDHHPHGLKDPSPVIDFVTAYGRGGDAAKSAALRAPKIGSVTHLARSQWDYVPVKPE